MTKKTKKKCATKTVDMAEECRRDWACAQKFNKIIWSKCPDTVFGLYEMLEKKGYVVRWNSPGEGFTTTVKKDLLDLYIAEKETANRMFMPYPSASSKKKGERMIADYRMAQRARLVYTTYLCESDGGGVAFALFRDPGTENCLVYVMQQPRPVDEAEILESLGIKP